MNSNVFGKTMENWRNGIDVRVLSNKKSILSGSQNQDVCHKNKKYLVMI